MTQHNKTQLNSKQINSIRHDTKRQESLVMSMFANGTARTMKANYTIDKEDIKVIRPLAYVRESATKEFAMRAKLPVISENCPACFEVPKERKRVKKLLAEEEIHNPKL